MTSSIEGHAQVVIEVQGGEVMSAHFRAMELRGFEHFVRGVPAEQMPVIVPRICGVCSTAHHVASVKALEDAYGVTPPPVARKIRELLLLGQLIQNQATSLFIFTMPDRLGVASIFQLGATERDLEKDRAETARRALQVRKAGTDLISLAGGQFIHPVKAVVGGVSSGIQPEAAAAMREKLVQALPLACDLFDYYWQMSLALRERIGTWGDDAPAFYIASTGDSFPNYDGDVIHVMLLDLMMPGMDGFQVLEEKRRDPSIRDIPVIIISSRDPTGDPIVSNTLTVTHGAGLSQRDLSACIQALGRILAPSSVEENNRAS